MGESWPLPLERIHFEHRALLEHGRHVGPRVPEVLHHDSRLFLVVVECLTPHLILREGLTRGLRYPRFAGQLADYLARSLFFTSSLALPAEATKALVAGFCGNTAMCRIMEDMVFTEPYQVHPRNRWTSPQMDGLAAEVREDVPLKLAASRLKFHYLTTAQALVRCMTAQRSELLDGTPVPLFAGVFAIFGHGNVLGLGNALWWLDETEASLR